jgi:hypothetical protein
MAQYYEHSGYSSHIEGDGMEMPRRESEANVRRVGLERDTWAEEDDKMESSQCKLT